MMILARFLMILAMLSQQSAAVNPPNAPVNLSLSGQQSGAHDEYCAPQGTWVGPASDGPASLPKACMPTSLASTPSPGAVHGLFTTLSALQASISSGSCGDVWLVADGTNLGSGLSLPGKGCDNAHWNTLATPASWNPTVFPKEGTRATPCYFGQQSMPNRAYPCAAAQNFGFTVVANPSTNAVKVNGGDHWNIIGARVTRVSTPGAAIYQLVDLSSTGATQTSNVIFARSWFEGVEGTFPSASQATDTSTTRAIYLGQSNHIAVIDSYFTNFYDTSVTSANGNTDAQCIAGGFGNIPNSGWGVYKFVNNHCEASGEGILLGGGGGPPLTPASCTILVNCNVDTPADLEVRQNYFFKPPQWNGNTTVPGGSGWPVVKNGFEMKTGVRALFEGNVVESCWYNAQGCGMFNVAPINQQSGGATPSPTCPTCVVTDFTYRYNYSYDIANGIAVYAFMPTTCPTCYTQGANRVSIHDNVIADGLTLGNLTSTSTGDQMQIQAVNDQTGTGLNKLQNIDISHNTFVKAVRSMLVFGTASVNTQIVNLVMQNNIWSYGKYGWVGIGSSGGCDGKANGSFYNALNLCASSWTVDHNAVFNWPTTSTKGVNWPTDGKGAGNFFFNGTAGVGFANYGTGDSNFSPANYSLQPSSPLHNAASDGSDLGADIGTMLAKISGVRE